jgi:single-strand DNA-binding protein
MSNLNTVVITGNLTRDPELGMTEDGKSICRMRVAVGGRRRGADGGWVDKSNYFDVVVWAEQGATCGLYLFKGLPVAVLGRLDWSEWTDKAGVRRESVEIVAGRVEFLDALGAGDEVVV